MIPWYWALFIAMIAAGIGFMCAAVLASSRASEIEAEYIRILKRLHDATGGNP